MTLATVPCLDSHIQREQLALEHMQLVHFIARRIHNRLPRHVEMDDLVQAGTLGLLDAMDKFDPSKNVLFRSYAQFRIRGAILDSLRGQDWGTRELRRQAREIQSAQATLAGSLGRVAADDEVAQEMALPLDEYHRLLGELRGLDLISTCFEDPEHEDTQPEIEAATRPEEDPFHLCAGSEMNERLAAAVGKLPERERQIVALYYLEELTMREIAEVTGVVESRVSQIHSSAMLRLRTFLKAKRVVEKH